MQNKVFQSKSCLGKSLQDVCSTQEDAGLKLSFGYPVSSAAASARPDSTSCSSGGHWGSRGLRNQSGFDYENIELPWKSLDSCEQEGVSCAGCVSPLSGCR
ncbi:hypothetical protein EK904_010332 [Melospiza melodia maxima]|nr:hypothetical protein EK904_010332 [Melospiza melodia maxima]